MLQDLPNLVLVLGEDVAAKKNLDPTARPSQERICAMVGGLQRITSPRTPHCALIGRQNMHDLRLFHAFRAVLDVNFQRAQIMKMIICL